MSSVLFGGFPLERPDAGVELLAVELLRIADPLGIMPRTDDGEGVGVLTFALVTLPPLVARDSSLGLVVVLAMVSTLVTGGKCGNVTVGI